MAEKIFSVGFLSGCLIWIPICAWVYTFISWMIQGEIDFLLGLAGIGAGFGLGMFALHPPRPDLPPYILLATVAMMVLFPTARSIHHRQMASKLEIESMKRAYSQLSFRPDNVGAKFRIAHALYKKGAHQVAMAVAEEALRNMPKKLFEEEERTLAQWKRAAGNSPEAKRISCVSCGKSNDAHCIFCQGCGAPILLDYARGTWINPGAARKIFAGWLVSISLLAVIPFLLLNVRSPDRYVLVGLTVLINGALLWFAFALKPETP